METELKPLVNLATADAVIAFVRLAQGYAVWIDGGWGVDALLGEQTREHCDLDIIVDADQTTAFREALLVAGYAVSKGDPNVFLSPEGLAVDIHEVHFDARGYGAFDLGDGRCWPFPPSAFAGRGQIGGEPVHCLSAEAQVACHGQGYEPTDKDLRDMALLQERFGVVLPLSLGVRSRS